MTFAVDAKSKLALPPTAIFLLFQPQKSAVAESKLSVSQNGVALHYKLSPQIENLNGQYTICNVNNTMHRKQGEVQSSNGVISIIDLPKGIYTFSITCNGKTYSTKWMK